MTGTEHAGNRILGTLRAADGCGVVRMEDRYDASIDDLWSAITDPARLAGRKRCDSDARMEALYPAYEALEN